ncbi:MAG: 3-isopropylmalate dehydratase small subunit [Thermodesulfobacteriota bacterium]|nr:3-isopropylmalate dehydratase small subunit [Thermodesulfobacteriota bacterium]
MKIKGRVWKFGDNINTDGIIPARYLNMHDSQELAKHCMEDIDPTFSKKVRPSDIIVGGKNFGCGSSREHAPIAIKASGISCVIATSFARIFYRNAFNMGLYILESPEASIEINEHDNVEVDLALGEIYDITTEKQFKTKPIPPFMQQLVNDGGLMGYVQRKYINRL